jgi:hypothetical protein
VSDEAIQFSLPAEADLDCFASLAMTYTQSGMLFRHGGEGAQGLRAFLPQG